MPPNFPSIQTIYDFDYMTYHEQLDVADFPDVIRSELPWALRADATLDSALDDYAPCGKYVGVGFRGFYPQLGALQITSDSGLRVVLDLIRSGASQNCRRCGAGRRDGHRRCRAR